MSTSLAVSSASPDFSFLDERSFYPMFSEGDVIRRMRFYVEGLRCSKCVGKIESLATSTPGMETVRVDFGKNLVHVSFDPTRINPSQIAISVAALGFKVTPLKIDQNSDLPLQRDNRIGLIRLAVAGALAGNIMGFSFAIYFGVTGPWLTLFSWLSFLMYIPVVTFVAWPFYTSALRSFKHRELSIDLPMTIASLAGFIFSTVQLLRGQTNFYFDSMSSFLFLILLARFIQRKLQARFLDLASPLDDFNRVRRRQWDHWTWVPAEDLRVGDTFLVEPGETLPVEATLQNSNSHFSLAWLSGESRPRSFHAGATVPAGAKLLSRASWLEYKRPLAQTELGQILGEVQKASLAKNRTISIADRWTQRLLGTVFSLALLVLVFYWHISPEEAIHRALALIVLACPCAMALGTPLAIIAILKKARRHGILVSDANVFEKINRVKNIFFDKTGTLTDPDLSLAIPQGLPDERIPLVYQKIILALENQSYHPIAFAFRKAFGEIDRLPPVGTLKEIPGLGVSGYVFGKFYFLGRHHHSDLDSCVLVEDEKPLFQFTFLAKSKPEARQTVDDLRARGIRIHLLSGDQSRITHKLADQLMISSVDVHANLSPTDKASIVAQFQNSMMVGDGVNDAPALLRAQVGVAVQGAVGVALKSSSIYLLNDSLESLKKLFDISQSGFQLIRRNLLISLVYNVVGATLALAGYINPLVAALLMPLSSGLILFSTWNWSRK